MGSQGKCVSDAEWIIDLLSVRGSFKHNQPSDNVLNIEQFGEIVFFSLTAAHTLFESFQAFFRLFSWRDAQSF